MKQFALIIIALLITLCACSPLLEKSIKEKTVSILAPQDNDTLPSGQVTFWWNELTSASKYRLQVVKPSFSSTSQLLLDTLIEGSKFSIQMTQGDYEWRIRGENANSQSQYSARKLHITNVIDLTSQNLILRLPSADAAFRDSSILFKWYTIATATEYSFQLEDTNQTVVFAQTVYADSIRIIFANQGRYVWKVKAKNSTTETQFANGIIYIDWTAPTTPVLVSPLYNDTLDTGPISFKWDRITTSISPITDSIFIYSDSLSNLFGNYTTNNDNFQLTLAPSSGYYYWRVRSVDKAGNQSGYSSAYRFKVK